MKSGKLGMSIVGGGSISSAPFGKGRPGIYISKVTTFLCPPSVVKCRCRLSRADQLTRRGSSKWETGYWR